MTSATSYTTLSVTFLLLFSGLIAVHTTAAPPPQAVTATRTINPDTVAPGGTFTVEVTMEAHGDVSAPSLDEQLPAGWTATEIDNAGFMFKPSTMQWVQLGAWSANDTATIVYEVTVPQNATETTYSLSGEVSGADVGPYPVAGATTVTVNQTPADGDLTADYTITPHPPIHVNETVQFTDTSHAHGEIINHTWTFNDGHHAYGDTVTYRIPEPGSYNVTLTVTDDKGRTAEKTTTITVKPSETSGDEVPGLQLTLTLAAAAIILLLNRKTQ